MLEKVGIFIILSNIFIMRMELANKNEFAE